MRTCTATSCDSYFHTLTHSLSTHRTASHKSTAQHSTTALTHTHSTTTLSCQAEMCTHLVQCSTHPNTLIWAQIGQQTRQGTLQIRPCIAWRPRYDKQHTRTEYAVGVSALCTVHANNRQSSQNCHQKRLQTTATLNHHNQLRQHNNRNFQVW